MGNGSTWLGWHVNARHIHPNNAYRPNSTSSAGFASGHPGGLHALAGDGAVHWVSEKTNMAIWMSLGTAQRVNRTGYWYDRMGGTTQSNVYGNLQTAADREWSDNGTRIREVQAQWP
jgi:hypothetical protein